MDIVNKIRYSKFGKKYLNEGPIYETLRFGKRAAGKVLRTAKSLLPEAEKYESLSEVLTRGLQSLSKQKELEQRAVESGEVVDVIVPIFNGYEFLDKLLRDLPRTKMSCRFILVDDKSTDDRIIPMLEQFQNAYPEQTILLKNEENYGFVKTVNRGLELSKNHVALVNTDTELPNGWLERLMYPILFEDKIASTTPYTNSGTIFSFPNFCYNNKIYKNLSCDVIDSYFRMLTPSYVEAPTGVGFCMGMNKQVIAELGVLDYETFERGFGEENDWCQRALKKGYKNVQVENLFVYHKHGGSFLSDEKERLIAEHLKRLADRYPDYDHQVGRFIKKDPNAKKRELAALLIDTHETKSVLYFDHSLGGGATAYLDGKKQEFIRNGACVSVIRYRISTNDYTFTFTNETVEMTYTFRDFEDILKLGNFLKFDEIYINELVTYPHLWDTQEKILQFKKEQNAKLIMLFHDYFALCPTINLVDSDFVYCGMPDEKTCEVCYEKKGYAKEYDCESHGCWVQKWKEFLADCEEVRCFSQDTLSRVKASYGADMKLQKPLAYTLVPHEVTHAVPIHKEKKNTRTLNIGFLGVLATHKGSQVVLSLAKEITEHKLPVRLKLIGDTDMKELSEYDCFSKTGPYTPDELPKLIYENDVDIFMIASIWPETFSYTAEEIIKMGMPVVSFDLGAPSERILAYAKGLVLSNTSIVNARQILNEIRDFAVKKLGIMDTVEQHKKVIYVAEYISFSSRYRMEHLAEELLYGGVNAVFFEAAKLPSAVNWDKIGAVVIYRCRYQKKLIPFTQAAHAANVPVYYDIDDYIFDYDAISKLSFVGDRDHKNFDVYCKLIRDCMEQSDRLLVSTEHLGTVTQESFPEKTVFVNRNVASMEMVILSKMALATKKQTEEIYLGYFSGSGTHNRDFELIADVILDLMKRYENVHLNVVGCLALPESFAKVKERVHETGFLDWKLLPEEIAKVDINLMPLEDTFFNLCKSENKWMEAALVQVPTIASYNAELDLSTQNGENIILCKNRDAWRMELEKMIVEPEYREKIAMSAHEYVMKYKTTLSDHSELFAYMNLERNYESKLEKENTTE